MPPTDQEFSILMQRVRRKSEGAWRELHERYGSHLLRVIRPRLGKRLRQKFDSTDFVQAVWASFFALPSDKLYFERPEGLAAFLAELARNKIVNAVRLRLQSLKFGASRECSFEVLAGECFTREPSPLAIAIAREELQRLLQSQSERDRTILHSLGLGNTAQQTAEELGVSRRTVHRVLGRVRSTKTHEPK